MLDKLFPVTIATHGSLDVNTTTFKLDESLSWSDALIVSKH